MKQETSSDDPADVRIASVSRRGMTGTSRALLIRNDGLRGCPGCSVWRRRRRLGSRASRSGRTGKQIFRFDNLGDEAQWTDALRMHEVISAAVDPVTALKVDAEALPAAVVDGIRNGSVDLTSPATTIALLKLNAVVGLKGTVETVNAVDRLARVGITCALCHSSVDNSFGPGIGKRLDGWANRDLNPGAIIALSPAVDAAMKAVFNSWGKGKFDPRHNVDGISNPVVIPPAYGLEGIHSVTYTGDGDEIAYWNRNVAVAEMGGQGSVSEPRLNLSITNGTQDLVTSKLPALQAYQLSLKAPAPPAGIFDATAALRGKVVLGGAGQCATCDSGALFPIANSRLHPPSDSMAEPASPSRVQKASSTGPRHSRVHGSTRRTSTTDRLRRSRMSCRPTTPGCRAA